MVADPAVVQASAVVFNATAGAPQSGNLATFTDPGGAEPNPSDPSGTIANHYTVASINWGDGTPLDTTTGAITYGGSPGSTTNPFTVSGTHTYAAAGSYTIIVNLNHEGVLTPLTTTAPIVNLGITVQPGLTATIGFWQGPQGQKLINSFKTTSTGLTWASGWRRPSPSCMVEVTGPPT